jgi:hypothetical protein
MPRDGVGEDVRALRLKIVDGAGGEAPARREQAEGTGEPQADCDQDLPAPAKSETAEGVEHEGARKPENDAAGRGGRRTLRDARASDKND